MLTPSLEGAPRLKHTWRLGMPSEIHLLLTLLEYETLRAEQPAAWETGVRVGLGSMFAPLTGFAWLFDRGVEFFSDSIDLHAWNQDVRTMLQQPEAYDGKILSLRSRSTRVNLTLLARTRKQKLFRKPFWAPEVIMHLDQEAPPVPTP